MASFTNAESAVSRHTATHMFVARVNEYYLLPQLQGCNDTLCEPNTGVPHPSIRLSGTVSGRSSCYLPASPTKTSGSPRRFPPTPRDSAPSAAPPPPRCHHRSELARGAWRYVSASTRTVSTSTGTASPGRSLTRCCACASTCAGAREIGSARSDRVTSLTSDKCCLSVNHLIVLAMPGARGGNTHYDYDEHA